MDTESDLVTARYRAVRGSSHSISPALALLHVGETNSVIACHPSVIRILAACVGYRTLEAHAASVAQDGVLSDVGQIRLGLHQLVECGLLRSHAGARGSLAADSRAPSGGIGTVGVITADRPHLLRRCLSSVQRQCNAHGRNPHLIVVDGSRSTQNRLANRAVVAEINRDAHGNVELLGQDDMRSLRKRLAEVCGPDCHEFAFTAGAAGPNRNIILLASGSEDVLLVDDDVIAETWTLPSMQNGVGLCGHGDSLQVDFFSKRSDALSALARADVDLLGSHEQLLGRPVTDVTESAEPVDLTEACAHVFAALEGSKAFVRVTFSGLVGDSGTYCPGRLLFSTGRSKLRLQSDRRLYERALQYRETYRIADRNIITHNPSCMAYCMGVAKNGLTPPFLPLGRNQDGVFGVTLAFMDVNGYFGHVPHGVLHNSTRPATYPETGFRSAAETRVSELFVALMAHARGSTAAADPARRLQRLAVYFDDLADMDLPEFVTFISDIVLSIRQLELREIEVAVAEHREHAEWWRQGCARYRDTLLQHLSAPQFFLPVEFHNYQTLMDGYSALQAFLKRVAATFGVWPSVWELFTSERGKASLVRR